MPSVLPPTNLLAHIQEQRQQYLNRLTLRVAHMRMLWDDVERSWSEEALRELALEAHRLTGSGATFGFAGISELCRALSVLLQGLSERTAHPTAEQRAHVLHLLHDLDTQSDALVTRHSEFVNLPSTVLTRRSQPVQPVAYVLDGDGTATDRYAAALEPQGYTVRVFAEAAHLLQAAAEHPPHVALVEGTAPPDGLEVVQMLRALLGADVVIVCISAHSDMDARLAAVRAGVDHFFAAPCPLQEVVNTVLDLTCHHDHEPYRVLVIDDDDLVAQCHMALLEDSGLKAQAVYDPRESLAALEAFAPEVVLMDFYMPYCTGVELAAVIRQYRRYAGLPIVFLSTETDETRQWQALIDGGDAFLTKPVSPRRLADVVASRARRARLLAELQAELTSSFDRVQAANKEKIDLLIRLLHARNDNRAA